MIHLFDGGGGYMGMFMTEAEQAEVWQRYADGASASMIGRAMGFAASSVVELIRKSGGIRPGPRCVSRRGCRWLTSARYLRRPPMDEYPSIRQHPLHTNVHLGVPGTEAQPGTIFVAIDDDGSLMPDAMDLCDGEFINSR